MNRYTVAMATQGLANYLKQQFPEGASVAISYDSRHCSREFAMISAQVLLSNGIKAYSGTASSLTIPSGENWSRRT